MAPPDPRKTIGYQIDANASLVSNEKLAGNLFGRFKTDKFVNGTVLAANNKPGPSGRANWMITGSYVFNEFKTKVAELNIRNVFDGFSPVFL